MRQASADFAGRYPSLSNHEEGDNISVIVVGRLKGDPEKIKQVFVSHAGDMGAVSAAARGLGAIHHRFLQGEGELLIFDEWDSVESFEKFFSSQPVIGQMMQEAGVAGPPAVEVYQTVETAGDF